MELTKEEIVAKFEPKRAALAKKLMIAWIIGFALILFGILAFLGIFNGGEIFDALSFLFLFAGIAILFVGVGIQGKKTKNLVNEVKKLVYDKYFPERKELHSGMSESQIMYPGFFEVPDRFHSSEYMESSWDGIPFKSSKYQLERREVHHDKNGTHTEYVTYAQGTMYFFDFERDFGQTVKIIEKGASLGNHHGLEKVETEFIEFNKKFKVFSSDQTQVFYLLTPQVQEKILGLEKIFKGSFHIAFIDSDLWVAVNDSNSSVKFPLRKPITVESIDAAERVIAAPKLLIDNLGIAKTKFKKDAGVKSE